MQTHRKTFFVSPTGRMEHVRPTALRAKIRCARRVTAVRRALRRSAKGSRTMAPLVSPSGAPGPGQAAALSRPLSDVAAQMRHSVLPLLDFQGRPAGRAAAQPGCRAGPGGNRRRCGYRTWRPRCRSARSPHRTSCRRRPGAPRLRGRAALPGHGRRPPRQDHQRARYSTVLPAECAGREGSAAPPGGGGGNRPGIDV